MKLIDIEKGGKTMYQFENYMAKDLYWVAKARSKEEDRSGVYNRIHVEKEDIVATDGHRMHILKSNYLEIPEGNYKVIVAKPNQVIIELDDNEEMFPNWKRIPPQSRSDFYEIIKDEIDGKNIEISFINLLYRAKIYAAFSMLYLDEALDKQIATMSLYGYKDEPKKSISNNSALIEYANREAIIMPLQLKEISDMGD